MPDLLIELLSEEIPARMQAQAARDLLRLMGERLRGAGLPAEGLAAYAGPRRLTLHAPDLPAATPDRTDELKGPKVSAPPQAVEGFLRKTGLAREALAEREGVLYAVQHTPGRPTPEIAAEALGEVMRAFPWPKSMRSGESTFRWVRPLKSVLFLFDGRVVPFEIDGVAAGDVTRGHRFMGSRGAPFAVTGFDDYRAHLAREFVVLDAANRRARILEGARSSAPNGGLELVEDEGLLDEVAGLAEWPVPVLGAMDPAFLDLPPEVIRTSMRTHQKYFAVRRPAEAGLAPNFVVVANVEAADDGAQLAAGNARVLSARLNDARFFWNEDTKPGAFERWNEKLRGVTFHAKLGSMAERVERIAALARELAPAVGADPDLAERAARLAKADLASAMVGEFPELQGIMGGYYARLAPFPLDGEGPGMGGGTATDGTPVEGGSASDAEPRASTPLSRPLPIEGERRRVVADAVRDHYKPVGPSDAVPTDPVTVAVALADKLDTLVGFFAIDEKPTGSKDPYALRRAALGVIRLTSSLGIALSLRPLVVSAARRVASELYATLSSSHPPGGALTAAWLNKSGGITSQLPQGLYPVIKSGRDFEEVWEHEANLVANELLAFFSDRLKVLLRDEGRRHDLVDAVFAQGDDDLVRVVARVEALSDFLATKDGANLLAGYTRAANILRAEEKKGAPLPLDGGEVGSGGGGAAVNHPGAIDPDLRAPTPIPDPSPIEGEGSRSRPPEEVALRQGLRTALSEVQHALGTEDFAGAMTALAALRKPVDAFFDRVLVNDPDPEVRLDRLRLLIEFRAAADRVADFSRIQG